MKIIVEHKDGNRKLHPSTFDPFVKSINKVIDNARVFLDDFDTDDDLLIIFQYHEGKDRRRTGLLGAFSRKHKVRTNNGRWCYTHRIVIYVNGYGHKIGKTTVEQTLGHELGHAIQWMENSKQFYDSQYDLESEAQEYAALLTDLPVEPIHPRYARNLLNVDRRRGTIPHRYMNRNIS